MCWFVLFKFIIMNFLFTSTKHLWGNQLNSETGKRPA